jgi:glutathione peroxidase
METGYVQCPRIGDDNQRKWTLDMFRIIAMCVTLLFGHQAYAVNLDASFDSIDGGTLALSEWRGQPILVVNTASQCAFTR